MSGVGVSVKCQLNSKWFSFNILEVELHHFEHVWIFFLFFFLSYFSLSLSILPNLLHHRNPLLYPQHQTAMRRMKRSNLAGWYMLTHNCCLPPSSSFLSNIKIYFREKLRYIQFIMCYILGFSIEFNHIFTLTNTVQIIFLTIKFYHWLVIKCNRIVKFK